MQKLIQPTPGKWQNCLGSFGPYVVAQSPGKDVRVAVCHYSSCTDIETSGQCEANARLIAAAPDLLEALLAALPFVEDAMESEDFKPGYVQQRSAMIRAAIAKAGA